MGVKKSGCRRTIPRRPDVKGVLTTHHRRGAIAAGFNAPALRVHWITESFNDELVGMSSDGKMFWLAPVEAIQTRVHPQPSSLVPCTHRKRERVQMCKCMCL